MNFKQFFEELKRRNVIKATLAYIISSWVIIQVMTSVLPIIGAPDYVSRLILVLLLIGFPLWIIFSWVYEITPDGIKKTLAVDPEASITHKTSSRLDKIILGTLVVAIALLVLNLFKDESPAERQTSEESLIAEATNEKSIAVLAFADMSPEQDQEYFSDGISEEILNLLAKIPELKVISRTSSFSFKGKDQNITAIGEALKVKHVLEGSVRKAGNELRITAQLIDAQSGAHLWSETFDRKLEDVFKIQDEIAAMISKQLRLTIMGELPKQNPMDPEAHNLYLKALALFNAGGQDNRAKAFEIIQEAIAKDSSHADSYVLRGVIANTLSYTYGQMPPQEAQQYMITSAEKALALERDHVGAYLLLAEAAASRLDFKEMAKYMSKINEFKIDQADLLSRLAFLYGYLGHLNTAINLSQKAIVLDPLMKRGYHSLATFHYYNDEPDKLKSVYEKIRLIDSTDIGLIGLNLLEARLKKNFRESYEIIQKFNFPFYTDYFKAFILFGIPERHKEAETHFKKFIEEFGHDAWPNIAHVYAFIKDKDNAFKWLHLAIDNKDGTTLDVINAPAFKNLHGDPRWNAFIARLNLPEDHGFHVDRENK